MDGTVFLLDASNSLIRRVQAAPAATATCAPNPAAAAGYVTSTFAGSGLAGAANGDFTTATFRQPKGVTVNPEGGLFMADNAGGTIRSISYSGSVTTIAGSLTGPAAPVDGILGVNRVYLAEFMAYDPTLQRLLFTDYTLIRYVSLGFENRSVTTLCGFWLSSGSNDGIGGRLTDGGQMVAVRTGPSTMVYYVMNTNTIRAITQSGVISTFVGSATEAGLVDGVGTAARLNTNGKQASLVHWPGANALIVADTFTIRRVSLDPATLGTVTRIGGSPTLNANYVSNTLANAAIFTLVTAMSLVSNRTLFLYDAGSYSFRALDLETSMVTTLSCPNPGGFSGYVDGELTDTRFGSIDGMAFDSDLGALFVSDGGNRRVRRIEGPF